MARSGHSFRRFLLAALCLGLGGLPVRAGDAFRWSVQYLIDNSRIIFGRTQKVSPRHGRGLAASPDGRYLYAGYIHSFNGAGEVRKIALEVEDYDAATVEVLRGPMGKAIATDDRGRVYIANNESVLVYDGALRERLGEISVGMCDGLATAREAKGLFLYTSDREQGSIARWSVAEHESGPVEIRSVSNFRLPQAVELRGVKTDGKGALWVADHKGNKVYKVSTEGQVLASADVTTPMDVALDGNRIFVSRDRERSISVFDEGLVLLGNLSVPWEELEISPAGNNHLGALAGLVSIPGRGLYVANEGGQTAGQRSTYGRADSHSDIVNGKLYRDALGDDNEPILHAAEVEVSSKQ